MSAYLFDILIKMAPVMMNNEEVAEHFPCYPTLSQFWKDSALGTTRAIIELLTSMLRSNTELNEFTGLVLAGLRKSMNKFDKVRNILNAIISLLFY